MNTPQTFRKRPATVEAMQYDGTRERGAAIAAWAGDVVIWAPEWETPELYVCQGRDSAVMLESGDWLVLGAPGDYYPVKGERFNALFEPVAERPGRG